MQPLARLFSRRHPMPYEDTLRASWEEPVLLCPINSNSPNTTPQPSGVVQGHEGTSGHPPGTHSTAHPAPYQDPSFCLVSGRMKAMAGRSGRGNGVPGTVTAQDIRVHGTGSNPQSHAATLNPSEQVQTAPGQCSQSWAAVVLLSRRNLALDQLGFPQALM